MKNEIIALKKEQDVCILAHYYQTSDIQSVADIVGDSFELARRAMESPQQTLLLCGVRFMAESAKILNPEKTVLFPVWEAGCPMADMITKEDVLRLREQHPGAAVVAYVNSTAEVKAVSDICCTSSSAERIVRSLSEDTVIFVPDQNLGAYVAERVPEKRFVFFDGYCPVHHKVTAEDVFRARRAHPEAKILCHPECRPEVTALCDGIGSTSWILSEIENAPAGQSFVIGTEVGVLERLQEKAPGRDLWLLRDGFICPNMKKTTLEDILHTLRGGKPVMEMDPALMDAARRSLLRMVDA